MLDKHPNFISVSESCNSTLLLVERYNYRAKVFWNCDDVGGSENCPDECVISKAGRRLACAVLLCSVRACVFSLVSRFSCHSVYSLQYHEG